MKARRDSGSIMASSPFLEIQFSPRLVIHETFLYPSEGALLLAPAEKDFIFNKVTG